MIFVQSDDEESNLESVSEKILKNSYRNDIESMGVIGNRANFSEETQSVHQVPVDDSIYFDMNLKYENRYGS